MFPLSLHQVRPRRHGFWRTFEGATLALALGAAGGLIAGMLITGVLP